MSKTIKVIDLLNMIAKGEEPPEKIVIVGHRYKYNPKTKDYDSDIGFANKDLFLHIGILKELNTIVEIIEEQPKIDIQSIEEFDVALLGQCDNWLQNENHKMKGIEINPYIIDTIKENTLNFQQKINQLIKVVKQLDKRKEN